MDVMITPLIEGSREVT